MILEELFYICVLIPHAHILLAYAHISPNINGITWISEFGIRGVFSTKRELVYRLITD